MLSRNKLNKTKVPVVMTTIVMAIMLMLVLDSPANNVSVYAKKHTECFNSGVSDGKDHPFDSSRFDRCGRITRMDS